jgi:dolichol-phosphate mannosyltransferase
MKRALLTGGSGFVGANLARRLLHDGHDVTLLLRTGHQNWRLKEIASNCRIVAGDVSDARSARDAIAVAKPDWVFHLAAYGAYPTQSGFEQMVATNLMGCVALLNACAEIGVEAFVQTGSSSEYGYKAHAAKEDDVLEPNSHYAITKAAATHYCQFTARTSGVRATTLRLYSIYGPYEEPTRLIPTLLLHCMEGKLPPLVSPTTSRDFVYVDDAVDCLVRAARANRSPGGAIYNLCTGIQSSMAAVVEQARELFGVKAEPSWGQMRARAWDTAVWVGDPTAVRRDLQWQATTALKDGLLRTMDWLRKDPAVLRFYAERIFPDRRI